jgi:hypothetical protein
MIHFIYISVFNWNIDYNKHDHYYHSIKKKENLTRRERENDPLDLQYKQKNTSKRI